MATVVGEAARSVSLPAALKEAGLTALVAFILALPMLGLHLGDIPGGVTIEPRFNMVAIGVAGVFIGRLAIALYLQHAPHVLVDAFAGDGRHRNRA